MIGSLAIQVEVLSGMHIETVAKDAVELSKKLGCTVNLHFDRCEILVAPFTREEEVIEEFKEY